MDLGKCFFPRFELWDQKSAVREGWLDPEHREGELAANSHLQILGIRRNPIKLAR
jgi:hypothetical protein